MPGLPLSIHGDDRDPDAFERLPLWTWIQALYLVVTSSKGISSVVLSRILGVTQSTAWRLGHSIREMMHDRDGKGPQLKDVIEVDIKYLGGAPKRRKDGKSNPRGKGTSKAKVLITAQRGGPAKATVIPSESADDIRAAIAGKIETGVWVMSDKQFAFGKAFASVAERHETVNHSAGEFVRNEVYSSSADGLGSMMERAKFGVWHKFRERHVQRYVDEVCFRWSNRIRVEMKSKNTGKKRRITKIVPVLNQIRSLICAGVGRRMRRTRNYGFEVLLVPPSNVPR
jgi:hypothetical protein